MSYLSNRQFKVRVGDELSDFYPVASGTPQGGVLGPLIFLLYMNDLPTHVTEGRAFMYADDTTIVVSGNSMAGVCGGLGRVISQFKSWCDRNRLIVNISKTQCMFFRNKSRHIDFSSITLNEHPDLKFTDSVRFLGVVLDSCLTWTPY